ncbi:MAG: DUF1365 domain-containing protein [Gammaproteobacteria bacterium]|jgi:hypothetical protein
MSNSYLYRGQVRHRRFAPCRHEFEYSLFMLYLDLDELPGLFKRFWLWSSRRPNLAWFRRADHLGDPQQPLADSVRDFVEQRSGRRPPGPVRLLTQLRYFGHGFNPVSFYYCFDTSDEVVEHIVVEVNNTPWGEQYCYLLNADEAQSRQRVQRYELEKQFHVSPFIGMDIHYQWSFMRPGKHLFVHLQNNQQGDKLFDASLKLDRQPISSASLAAALLRYPLMTMKVVAAIYYQALRLWLKKVPFHTHPGKKEAPQAVKTL